MDKITWKKLAANNWTEIRVKLVVKLVNKKMAFIFAVVATLAFLSFSQGCTTKECAMKSCPAKCECSDSIMKNGSVFIHMITDCEQSAGLPKVR